ncbi:MAG TPA: hypothetical protein DCZ05_06100 [Deltaproteobacteria bacterium]|nr:MAG: hypothetical protein A2X89_08870 [Deltaproteobacteria bacterium GWD2_55_8]HBA39310.1 hypothetical protein [Deltaproteobacteria bacterium]
MIGFKTLEFVGEVMQAFGVLFVTVQLWGPAWGLGKRLHLGDPAGSWLHLVREGLLLLVVGSALHILAEFF